MTLQIRARLQIIGLLFCTILITSCVYTSEDQTGQRRNLDPFTGIDVGGAFQVILNQNGRNQVMIEADEAVIDKVRTVVKGNILHIEKDWEWFSWDHDDITVYVDIDQLNYLESSGASEVTAETPIRVDDMEIKVSGAADLSLELYAKNLDVKISGAAEVDVSGDSNTQKVRISGSGDYHAQHLKSEYTNAKTSGAASAVVFASDEIEASASGAGSISYYGDPKIENINSSGAGSITRR